MSEDEFTGRLLASGEEVICRRMTPEASTRLNRIQAPLLWEGDQA